MGGQIKVAAGSKEEIFIPSIEFFMKKYYNDVDLVFRKNLLYVYFNNHLDKEIDFENIQTAEVTSISPMIDLRFYGLEPVKKQLPKESVKTE